MFTILEVAQIPPMFLLYLKLEFHSSCISEDIGGNFRLAHVVICQQWIQQNLHVVLYSSQMAQKYVHYFGNCADTADAFVLFKAGIS